MRPLIEAIGCDLERNHDAQKTFANIPDFALVIRHVLTLRSDAHKTIA